MFGISLVWILLAIVVVLIVVFMTTCYVKAPPSTAYILSGVFKKPRVYVGRGGWKIPIFERLDKVYLGQFTVEVSTDGTVPTHDWIDVRVEGVAKVAVYYDPEGNIKDIIVDEDDEIVGVEMKSGDEISAEENPTSPTSPRGMKQSLPTLTGMDGIRLAGRNFLNMTAEMIAKQLEPSLQGNLKEIVGAINLKELSTNREEFSRRVMQSAAPDMMRLGIRILSFNVQKVEDNNGLIKDLGADNTWTIKKTAAQKKAISLREIAETEAENDKKANDARVTADLEIAEKKNTLKLKQAALKKEADTQQAVADAAYDIQKQDQQLIINEKTVAASTAKTKKEQELTKEKVVVAQNEAEAQKTRKKIDSEADKLQTEISASAELEKRKRDAEAELYEARQKAEARKALADAELYAKQQEAAGIRALGEADGAATEAKLRGEAAGMEKKAEAYKQYGEAAMASMVVEQLPAVFASVGQSLSSIKDVKIIGTGTQGGAGITGITGNFPVVIAQGLESLKAATGIDIAGMLTKKTNSQSATPMEEKKENPKPNPTKGKETKE